MGDAEEGTPEFNLYVMLALMDNVSLPTYDRLQAAKQAIDILHGLLEEQAAQARFDLEQALYEERAGRDI